MHGLHAIYVCAHAVLEQRDVCLAVHASCLTSMLFGTNFATKVTWYDRCKDVAVVKFI